MNSRFLKNKKVVFLDGDGTLWYPKKTKYSVPPHWIYKKYPNSTEYLPCLQLIHGVLNTLKKVQETKLKVVLLSTHPIAGDVGDHSLLKTVRHFKLEEYFDEIYSTEPRHEAKGLWMIKILKQHNLFKSDALMVGDNYFFDYQSARSVRIDAVLIKTPYVHKLPKNTQKIIKGVSDLV